MRTEQVIGSNNVTSISGILAHTAVDEFSYAPSIWMSHPRILEAMPIDENLLVGSFCSEYARLHVKWMVALLCKSTQFESTANPLQLMFNSYTGPMYPDMELEHILPAQIPKNEQIIEATVYGAEYEWSGLALSDVELDAIIHEGRDA